MSSSFISVQSKNMKEINTDLKQTPHKGITHIASSNSLSDRKFPTRETIMSSNNENRSKLLLYF
jgi:hypothetical protein